MLHLGANRGVHFNQNYFIFGIILLVFFLVKKAQAKLGNNNIFGILAFLASLSKNVSFEESLSAKKINSFLSFSLLESRLRRRLYLLHEKELLKILKNFQFGQLLFNFCRKTKNLCQIKLDVVDGVNRPSIVKAFSFIKLILQIADLGFPKLMDVKVSQHCCSVSWRSNFAIIAAGDVVLPL